MNELQGFIKGEVSYREGDGIAITIRKGPCRVAVTALDATISWVDGETHGSAAIPLPDYRRFLASGALTVDTATPASAPTPPG